MITSKGNSTVLWHFFGFNCHRYEMLMSVWFTWPCNSTPQSALRWQF